MSAFVSSDMLLAGEVEVSTIQGVSLSCAEKLQTVTLLLTNFRLFCLSSSADIQPINLREIVSHNHSSTFLSGKKIKIETLGCSTFLFSLPRGSDGFVSKLNYYLDKKSWLAIESVQEDVVHNIAPSLAGVGGLIRRQERDLSAATAIQQTALSDMESLIKHASQVIKIVEQYCAIKSKGSSSTLASSNEPSDDAEVEQLGAILADLGVIAPVTKHTSSGRDDYLNRLAIQISDLLLSNNCMHRLGGMITLTDAFFLYNKARGSSLCSPEDFLTACQKMRNPLSLTRYPSGVYVIRLQSISTDDLCSLLLKFAVDKVCISSIDVSKKFRLPLLPAKEMLLAAEESGLLCRDESFNGLYFYPNIFD